ncbi:MAG TPA: multidrug effflux MFS transporter [Acetobacteraceae bacterium]|nr:multidrug effflux MFS transporter [Acetobacteraceae bacterium]
MSATIPRRRLALILGTIAAVGPFTTDMYLPAFPAVGADLGATPGAVQGTLVTYFLALALGQLAYGPLSDRFGRRGPLLGGFAVYTLASIGCALAQDIGALSALRFLQALGGCSGMVIARAVVRDVAEGAENVRLMASLMLVMGVAPVIAPTIGGLMLGLTGWRGIFLVLALYGVLVIALIAFALRETLPPSRRRRDSPVATLALFGALLRERHFLGHALATALPIAGMFAYIIGSPYVFMELFGISPQLYGVIFGLNAAGIVGMSQVISRLAHRGPPERLLRGTAWVPVMAGAVVVLGALLGSFWVIAAGLFGYVASIGAVVPLAVAAAMARQGHAAGSASALIGVMQFGLGGVLGAVIGAVHDGTALPMAASVAACGLGGLLALRVLAPRAA